MEDKPRRNTDTSAATRTNQMRKWRRWALELQRNGWNGGEPIAEPADPREQEN